MTRHRIAIVGVGATGSALARAIAGDDRLELAGGVDPDPAKAGRSLGEITGADAGGAPIVATPAELPAVDLAIVTTTSRLDVIADTLAELLALPTNVVSLNEELSYPWHSHPETARRLDELAREHGVSLLGTGCNPGIVMDTLPIVLSAATTRVRSIELLRTADVRHFGPQVVKLGIGMSAAELEAKRGSEVFGHVGFEQSISQLADALGWRLNGIDVSMPEPAVFASEERAGPFYTVARGEVAVIVQRAVGRVGDEEPIRITEYLGFVEQGDDVHRGDTCRITGEDQVLELRCAGGFNSALTSTAMVANMIAPTIAAAPGLRTMGDFPVRALASKGAHRAAAAAAG